MSQEIEQAYAVNPAELPSLAEVPAQRLSQVYFTPFPSVEQYPEVAHGEWRIRTAITQDGTKKLKAAIKLGDKASGSRTEIECALDEGDFGTTLADQRAFAYGVISKTRYDFGDNLTLDHFDQTNSHAWLAEKEFARTEDVTDWTPPAWCQPVNNLPSNRAMALSLVPEANESTFSQNDLVERVTEKQKKHGHVVVSFSGMSGSGKSTLAKRLAEHFDATYIEADHYHIGQTQLLARHGEVNHDLPHAYDYQSVAHDIVRLAKGEPVTLPRYDYRTAEREIDGMPLAPNASKITVVDGLYAREITDHISELAPDIAPHDVLVDTPLYVCVLRRIMRDVALTGTAGTYERATAMDPEETLRYLHQVAIPTYNKHASDRELFDTVLR